MEHGGFARTRQSKDLEVFEAWVSVLATAGSTVVSGFGGAGATASDGDGGGALAALLYFCSSCLGSG